MPWIEDFVAVTGTVDTAEIFRRWTAITTVAMALERKVWITTNLGNLYPNLYTLFVAPPGKGKGLAFAKARDFISTLEDLHFAGSSLTKAAFIDELKDASRSFTPDGELPTLYHALGVVSNELGVLLPKYDPEFMAALTDIYDGFNYRERRRTNNLQFEITNPCVNLVAACTPSYLMSTLPDGAWDQGFMSRCLMIYNGEDRVSDIFDFDNQTNPEEILLKKQLKKIGKLSGQFTVAPETAAQYLSWRKAGEPEKPSHPKLVNYNSRRRSHLLKLMMVVAGAEETLLITPVHLDTALGYLIEAEFFMPDIFKAMKNTGTSAAYSEAYHFIFTQSSAGKNPVEISRVVNFLKERVPVYSIFQIIETMIASNMLKEINNVAGLKCFLPGDKHPDD